MQDSITINPNVDLNSIESLNDLELKEFEGEVLSKDEMKALHLFRQLRLSKLKKQRGLESEFHTQFEYFRKLSNFIDYKVFLNNIQLD